ncbi:MAG: Dabb family protein [Mucilaginibacter sp.]|nr:Dabb family protein [Mucilaginibacter sp.]
MFLKNTFVHHVHFWLKNKEDKARLIEGLNTLIPITHIRDMHIGAPADTDREVIDRSYDVSLLLLFNDKAAQDAYQADPTHVIFAEEYAKPLCAKVVVQDSVNI